MMICTMNRFLKLQVTTDASQKHVFGQNILLFLSLLAFCYV